MCGVQPQVLHLNTNFKIEHFKITVGQLRLGWMFEPRSHYLSQMAALAV